MGLYQACGIDAALRHGSVVLGRFKVWRSNGLRYHDSEILYLWDKHASESLRLASEPLQVHRLALKMGRIIKKSVPPQTLISIDWDPISNWRARRKQVAQQAFFMGSLGATLVMQGYEVYFLTPLEVRRSLNLTGQWTKEKTQEFAIEKLRIPSTFPQDPDGDLLDSLILAYSLVWKIHLNHELR